MTNGEKFKETFGFDADGSRVIAVNSTWWDCEFQNSKPVSDELVKRLRDAATMSEALAVLLPHSAGNATAKLYNEAADAIEELSKPRNTVHLCTSCKYQYPECPADTGVVFGRGKGNDNICQCADYVAKIPHWIPVTERLPEIDEKHHCSKDVLAYLKDGGMCFTALEENIFGQACFECERNPAVEEEMIVTHWMPLPEPPKEET